MRSIRLKVRETSVPKYAQEFPARRDARARRRRGAQKKGGNPFKRAHYTIDGLLADLRAPRRQADVHAGGVDRKRKRGRAGRRPRRVERDVSAAWRAGASARRSDCFRDLLSSGELESPASEFTSAPGFAFVFLELAILAPCPYGKSTDIPKNGSTLQCIMVTHQHNVQKKTRPIWISTGSALFHYCLTVLLILKIEGEYILGRVGFDRFGQPTCHGCGILTRQFV